MDNPWSLQEASNSFRNEEINTSEEAPQRRRRQDDSSSSLLSCLQALVKVCHVGDGIVGILLVSYGLFIRNCHLVIPLILTLGSGMLLLVRAVSGLASIHHDGMHRFGLRLSAVYLSPMFALVDLIFSSLFMGNHALLVQYAQTHASELHLSDLFVRYMAHHHHAVWIVFLSVSLVEILRWYLVSIFQQWLLQMDTSLGSHPDVELLYTRPTTLMKRPWWWQHSHNEENVIQEPLLPHHDWVHYDSSGHNYSMHHGVNSPTSFWARWFQSPQKEEEEEVDFASVQEEWASRSQEDPFWWSREEGEVRSRNVNEETRDEEQADLSWATPAKNG